MRAETADPCLRFGERFRRLQGNISNKRDMGSEFCGVGDERNWSLSMHGQAAQQWARVFNPSDLASHSEVCAGFLHLQHHILALS